MPGLALKKVNFLALKTMKTAKYNKHSGAQTFLFLADVTHVVSTADVIPPALGPVNCVHTIFIVSPVIRLICVPVCELHSRTIRPFKHTLDPCIVQT